MALAQIDEAFFSFVRSHADEDPIKLRLKYKPERHSSIDLAITHLECVKKAKGKFIGDAGETIAPQVMLSPLSVEQASGLSTARLHVSLVKSGSKVLDMTCGMGIDTIAFATLGKCDVTTCEMEPFYAEVAEYNFGKYANIHVVKGDSVEYLKGTTEGYDVIFIDPARRDSNGGRVYNIHDCTPDLCDILPLLLKHAPRIIAKLSPMLDITQTIKDLSPMEIYSVEGDGGECKEILAVIEEVHGGETSIKVVHENGMFCFTQSDENAASAVYGSPEKGDVLYEPCAAAMKAAPFRLLSAKFGLKKLHPNTHLYFSEQSANGFPGKEYEIIDVINFSSSEIKSVAARYPKCNVATRNFILTPEQLTKKLKVKNGGDIKLFGVTLYDNTRKLVVTRGKGKFK